MGSVTKQWLAGVLTIVCTLIMIFCIGRMIPYGLSGEASKVKDWFIPVIIACIIGLLSAVAYYYFRAQGKQMANTYEVAAKTLANLGEQTHEAEKKEDGSQN